jgi:hypothetical protein
MPNTLVSVTFADMTTSMFIHRDTYIFLFFIACFDYFLWFLHKTSSLVFVRSHARKYMRTRSSTLLSLFRAQQGYTKKEPPWSSL